MTYQEQIKHPKWQKKRLEVLEYHGFACERCEIEDKTLNVHHKIYRKGKKAWEYELDDLACLCEDCHKVIHSRQDELKELMACLYEDDLLLVSGYVKAIYATYGPFGCPVTGESEAEGASDFFRVNPSLPIKHRDGDEMAELARMIHGGRFEHRRG